MILNGRRAMKTDPLSLSILTVRRERIQRIHLEGKISVESSPRDRVGVARTTMSASVAALHGLTVRRGAARTPRVRRITTRAVEEPKESTADEPKAVGGGLPPGIKTRPAPDVDPSITGDWRTGKIWRPPPGTPKFRVDLGKGTVEIVDEEEERRKYARMRAMNAAAAAGKAGIDTDADPAALVPEKQIKLRDNGNVVIAAMTEEDCVDATKLIMALFFKVRPQDFLAKDRLQKEQSERVYQGLVDGVVNGKDRLLVAAKVGGKVVGVAEVSLPGGKRFGAEKLEPRAPEDEPYISDVAVAPNQGKRGIGRQLVRACEAAMCAKGLRKMYTHTKVDNEAAQALFERAGYVEPAEIKASLTQMQIAQRGTKGGPLAKLGLVEVGHILLAKELDPAEY